MTKNCSHSKLEKIHSLIRKILVSVKFVSAILGLEMAAPILWTPEKMRFFLQENKPMSIKFRVFWGGFGGGRRADFIFMGARIFLILVRRIRVSLVRIFLSSGIF